MGLANSAGKAGRIVAYARGVALPLIGKGVFTMELEPAAKQAKTIFRKNLALIPELSYGLSASTFNFKLMRRLT